MPRPARPQGLPQRQNPHIKFNFWPPNADLSEEDGEHRRGAPFPWPIRACSAKS
jgi:hypothetical protein